MRQLPASHNQISIWLMHESDPLSGVNNTSAAFRVHGPLSEDRVRRWLQQFVNSHEAMRTSFHIVSGQLMQRIHEHVPGNFQSIDGRFLDAASLRRKIEQEAQTPFDLTLPTSLLRVVMVQIRDDERIALVVAHHIVMDGWSAGIVLRSFFEMGQTSAIPSSYEAFTQWQSDLVASQQGESSLSFWKKQLAGDLPVLDLPTDRMRPVRKGYKGESIEFNMPPEIGPRLKAMAQQENATLFSMLLSAYYLVLSESSGQRDIIIGTPAYGRRDARFRETVGYLANPVPIRIHSDGKESFASLARRVRQLVSECFENSDYPLQLLGEKLKLHRSPSHSPIFQAQFVFQTEKVLTVSSLASAISGHGGSSFSRGDLKLTSYPVSKNASQFDVGFVIAEDKGLIAGYCEFSSDLFEKSRADSWRARFQQILLKIADGGIECQLDDLMQPAVSNRKRLVVKNGYRFSLEDVEDALRGQADISDAQVAFDSVTNELKLSIRATDSSCVDPAAIRSDLRKILPNYQIPDSITITGQLTKSESAQLVIASNFVSDPLAGALDFWMRELKIEFAVESAPFDTVIQQLLDPASILCRNTRGINVLTVKLTNGSFTRDLASAVKSHRNFCDNSLIICICPSSEDDAVNNERLLAEEISSINGLHVVGSKEFLSEHPNIAVFASQTEADNSIPYTDSFYISIATTIAKWTSLIRHASLKVLVLDCDNTLWTGVVGEDGLNGIRIEDERLRLQRAILNLQESGLLLCLSSKNQEEDVLGVLDERPEMILRREHFVSIRVNWKPKSENLHSLAEELNLGLDSFAFIDDSAIEIDEVRQRAPAVRCLHLPSHSSEWTKMLQHFWPLARLRVTEEDRIRTRDYQQESARKKAQATAVNFQDFLSSLELAVTTAPLTRDDIVRASQLTMRTNQFNVSTIRRTEAEIATLIGKPDFKCLRIDVSDRFGDYGFVGLMIVKKQDSIWQIDTLLLSCRALGRGVEFHMLRYLAVQAQSEYIEKIQIEYIRSDRNAPALEFLDRIGTDFKTPVDSNGSVIFHFPCSYLASLALQVVMPKSSSATKEPTLAVNSNQVDWNRVAHELHDFERIIERIKADRASKSKRKAELVEPKNDLEKDIIAIWEEVLGLEGLGTNESFFDLGGTSILAVRIISLIQERFPMAFPYDVLFQRPTVSELAEAIQQSLSHDATAIQETIATVAPSKYVVNDDSEELQALRQRIEELERAQNEPIAIVGLGCRFPAADNPFSFWQNLEEGMDAVSDIPKDRWDVDQYYSADIDAPGKSYANQGGFLDLEKLAGFDASFFGISKAEARMMDPQQRLALEVSWEALENAGIPPGGLSGSKTGVFFGVCNVDFGVRQLQKKAEIGPYVNSGVGLSVIAGRVSYTLGLTGPSFVVDTACSSSLVAIHLACQSLRKRESHLALAGGVNVLLIPETFVGFCKARMLSPTNRCKAFDESADGYARGEGCGVIVLKRLSDAQASNDRILAVIRGSAVNQDGPSGGLTVPSVKAQKEVIVEALKQARVHPSEITYVEAHGSGTQIGDPIEIQGLDQALRPGRSAEQPLWVGSVKSNIAHLEAAAGVAGVIKVALALNAKRIPRHLHFKSLNPLINTKGFNLQIPLTSIPWDGPKNAGVSGFAFQGTNAHIILSGVEGKRAEGTRPGNSHFILCLSAMSAPALTEMAARYRRFFRNSPNVPISDICFTANAGRDHFTHRAAIVARSHEEFVDRLSRLEAGEPGHGLAMGAVSKGKSESARSRVAVGIDPGEDWEKFLIRLSAVYISGTDVDWSAFYSQAEHEKVAVPTYPFQRTWLWDTPEQSANVPQAQAYEIQWQQKALDDAKLDAIGGKTVVIIKDEGSLGTGLMKLVREKGGHATVIAPGEIDSLGTASDIIIYLAGIDVEPAFDEEALADGLRRSFLEPLSLIQTIGSHSSAVPSRIFFVTQGSDGPAHEGRGFAQAPMAALGRVAALEFPKLHFTHIDLPSKYGSDHVLADVLLREVMNEDKSESRIAWSNGLRHVARLNDFPSSAGNRISFSEDSSFLITGGWGALGLNTAAWMASRGAKHIVLTGRDIEKGNLRKEIAELRESGVNIYLRQADMGRKEQVQSLFSSIKKNLPPLRGIIHAAGTLADATIFQQDEKRLSEVMHPKAYGAIHLHSEIQRLKYSLDFLVYFSSASGLIGNPGQANYAAANCFLDAFACFQRSMGIRATSVLWGPWKGAGMTSGHMFSAFEGSSLIEPESAYRCLEAILGTSTHEAIVLAMDWKRFLNKVPSAARNGILRKMSSKYLGDNAEESKPVNPLDDLHANLEKIPSGERIGLVADILREKITELLEGDAPESFGGDEDFSDIGLDSLLGLGLREFIGEVFRCEMAPSYLFDHPTLDQLSHAISQKIEAKMKAAPEQTSVTLKLLLFSNHTTASSAINDWKKNLGPRIEFVPVDFQGVSEEANGPRNLFDLSRRLMDEISADLEGTPYVLVGHSAGALVAFEFAREAKRRGLPEPLHLFVSAFPAPTMVNAFCEKWSELKTLELLNDADFFPLMMKFGLIHTETRMTDFKKKLIRASIITNILLYRDYVYNHEGKLEGSITALFANDDVLIGSDHISAWGHETKGSFESKGLPGKHTYWSEQSTNLMELIRVALTSYVSR